MLFTTSDFFILCFITFLLYYLPILRKFQLHILLLSSFVFYGYHTPSLLILLILTLLINGSISWLVIKKEIKLKRLFTTSGVVLNLTILIFYKYSPLIATSFFIDIHDKQSIGYFLLMIPLPIGISFYTFQGLSLLLDAWWGKTSKKVNGYIADAYIDHLLRSSVFIAFFPQLIAGPILRSDQFMPQIGTKFLNKVDWRMVIHYLLLGYFLKMVIADNMKEITAYLNYPSYLNMSAYSLIILIFGFTIQIFADFAGYSYIALGLAGIFGYDLILNFNFPYISQDMREYWKRWHISLYEWFNTYLFSPLTMQWRYWGLKAILLATLIVFALSGIWHGASWNYGIWGTFHGIVLIIEIWLLKKVKWPSKLPFKKALNTLIVLTLVTFSYTFFFYPDLKDTVGFFNQIVSNFSSTTSNYYLEYYVYIYAIPVIIFHWNYFRVKKGKVNYLAKYRNTIYGIMLAMIVLNSGRTGDFIYFQF